MSIFAWPACRFISGRKPKSGSDPKLIASTFCMAIVFIHGRQARTASASTSCRGKSLWEHLNDGTVTARNGGSRGSRIAPSASALGAMSSALRGRVATPARITLSTTRRPAGCASLMRLFTENRCPRNRGMQTTYSFPCWIYLR